MGFMVAIRRPLREVASMALLLTGRLRWLVRVDGVTGGVVGPRGARLRAWRRRRLDAVLCPARHTSMAFDGVEVDETRAMVC